MEEKWLTLAVIGATGLVGRTMLAVLEEQKIPIDNLIPVASERSEGSSVSFLGRDWTVSTMEDGLWSRANVALLSAGAPVSRRWVPDLTSAGVTCIDNSSAFRQDTDVPLIVPEINFHVVKRSDRLIANPNCSTIQLAMVLAPLHKAFVLEEVVVSTYQAASGVGQKGKNALLKELAGGTMEQSPFPCQLADNLIPAINDLRDEGYFFEEWKLIHETRKILGLENLRIFPTAVRVPIAHCHGEAVHLVFRTTVAPERAREVLSSTSGVVIVDDPARGVYPLPLDCEGSDTVYVGRIRQLAEAKNTLDLWIVADNLRKGAATNAVQILSALIKNNYL